jgi:peptide/nickel transport system permease protein/oligopeptide transport system permease protein
MSDFETVASSELPSATKGLPGDVGAPNQPIGLADVNKPRSLAADAWYDLRHNPLFWIGVVLVIIILLITAFPSLFTSASPDTRACELSNSLKPPDATAPFGYDFQGCNVYARTIYGTRNSVGVGFFATLMAGIIAFAIGLTGGFFGGWVDSVLARVTDIALGIPLLLAAIVLLRRISNSSTNYGIWPVVFTLGILGWTTAARVVRSSVITARQQDYVQAARMLGASNRRIMLRHILPNAMAPAIVVLTIALGAFISSEAALSYLGIGLKPPAISWGGDIAAAQPRIRQAWWPLAFPATFLALTVLAFIMLGDAIRSAFDPKSR